MTARWPLRPRYVRWVVGSSEHREMESLTLFPGRYGRLRRVAWKGYGRVFFFKQLLSTD